MYMFGMNDENTLNTGLCAEDQGAFPNQRGLNVRDKPFGRPLFCGRAPSASKSCGPEDDRLAVAQLCESQFSETFAPMMYALSLMEHGCLMRGD